MAGPSALSAVTLPEGLKAVRFRLVSLAPVAVLSAAVMLSLCQKEGMLTAPPYPSQASVSPSAVVPE